MEEDLFWPFLSVDVKTLHYDNPYERCVANTYVLVLHSCGQDGLEGLLVVCSMPCDRDFLRRRLRERKENKIEYIFICFSLFCSHPSEQECDNEICHSTQHFRSIFPSMHRISKVGEDF